MPILLDGKSLFKVLQARIASTFLDYKGQVPCLGILQVGNKEDSNIYVAHKLKVAQSLGFLTKLIKLPENSSQDEIISCLRETCSQVTGIIVQLPLLSNKISDLQKILDTIPPKKDIDGLSSYNLNSSYDAGDHFLPATAKGIILLLKHYKINITSNTIAVVGQSNIVGRPLANYLSKFKNNTIKRYVKETPKNDLHEANIVIVATGQYEAVKASDIADNSILVDVGIHRNGSKIHGDLNFEECAKKAAYISPVPGGVGPLTVISLMLNLIKALILQNPTLKNHFKDIKSLLEP